MLIAIVAGVALYTLAGFFTALTLQIIIFASPFFGVDNALRAASTGERRLVLVVLGLIWPITAAFVLVAPTRPCARPERRSAATSRPDRTTTGTA